MELDERTTFVVYAKCLLWSAVYDRSYGNCVLLLLRSMVVIHERYHSRVIESVITAVHFHFHYLRRQSLCHQNLSQSGHCSLGHGNEMCCLVFNSIVESNMYHAQIDLFSFCFCCFVFEISRELLSHENVRFNDNGTVSTEPRHPLVWDEEKSVGRSENDTLMLPNIALLVS